MITDSRARAMYNDLKRKLGKRRTLKITALQKRGISERDLFRCVLSSKVKCGIELMHEKYVQGRDRIAEAQDKYLTDEAQEALPDLDPDRV
jgi:hypothetical protein